MFGYIEGYRLAAQAVFEAAIRDRKSPEYFIWPLANLWRHFLELSMKDLIAMGREIQGDPSEFPTSHRLMYLWREVRKYFELTGHGDSSELPIVETTIAEFETIDPAGVGFRYPVDRGFQGGSLPNAPKYINLGTLEEQMEALANFFDAARMALRHHLDQVNEMLAAGL